MQPRGLGELGLSSVNVLNLQTNCAKLKLKRLRLYEMLTAQVIIQSHPGR